MSAEPDIARGDSMNVREALAALDFHIAKAQKRGDYGAHSDLEGVKSVLEDLRDRMGQIEATATKLQEIVEDAQRKARAGIESLSRLPS